MRSSVAGTNVSLLGGNRQRPSSDQATTLNFAALAVLPLRMSSLLSAQSLGHDEVLRLLTTNLNEEEAANTKLTTIALRKGVNDKASAARDFAV